MVLGDEIEETKQINLNDAVDDFAKRESEGIHYTNSKHK